MKSPLITIAAALFAACTFEPGNVSHDEPTQPSVSKTKPTSPSKPAAEHQDAGFAPNTKLSPAGGEANPPAKARPILIDFTRDHCLPCELMRPWVEELRATHRREVDITEINIDRPENKNLGLHFKVRSIPTQVYVDAGGKEVRRHVGLATKAQMEATLRAAEFIE